MFKTSPSPLPRRVLGVALTAAVVSGLAVTSSASAAGGASIAAAPTVAYGQQQFGNTASDDPGRPNTNTDRSWWKFPVTAGDLVTLDWEATNNDMSARLFPVGTTDFTFPQINSLKTSYLNSNQKAELTWTAAVSGLMPLTFETYYAKSGPVDFVAYIQRAVSVSLSAISSLSQTGTVAISLRNPDGVAINDAALVASLQVKPHGSPDSSWASVGAAVTNAGVATVNYTLPDGLTGLLDARAISEGAGYISNSGTAITVPGPPAPPAPAPAPAPAPVVAPPTPTARAVSVSRVHGRYRGRVTSTQKSCRKNVTVTLLRKSTGAKVYGTTVTRVDGSWTMRTSKIKGKVYAAVPQATIGSLLCGQARSGFIGR